MRKITFLLLMTYLMVALPGWSQLFITELADPNNIDQARFVEIYNAGPSAVDLSAGYDLQRWTNNNTLPQAPVELTGTIAAGGFYIVCNNAGTFLSTYGFAADQNMGIGGPADSNGDDQIALRDPSDAIIDMFGVPGEDGSGTNHEFEDGRAERKATVTTGNATYTFAEWNIWNDTGAAGTTNDPQDAPGDFDPGSWIGATGGPALAVSPNSLAGFSYVETAGGPSASQSFTVEGVDLTADITVTPTTNYEISLDDITYQLTAITLTQSGGSVATTTVYTRLKAGLPGGDYNENITCSSAGADDKLVACSGTVEAPATTTLPYSEPFDTNLGDCYTYSVSGATEVWSWGEYGGNGYAEINGYNTGDTETDWLILPGVDMDAYANEYLTFDMWWQFGIDDASNYLKLYYSADYPGIGDPTTYTWTEITFTLGASTTWTNSGLLDISGITGTNVYFGFKYNYEPVNYRWWQLDNISLFEAANIDVTFQVNMEEQTVGGNVYLAGEFNGWNSTADQMTDGNLDNIYEVTLTLLEGVNYEYKFVNGGSWENVPNECAQNGNRFVDVGSTNFTIDPVCFGSCQNCGIPEWNITFRVDMKNETVGGDVYIAGDFNSWSDGLMTNTSGTIYEATILLEEGATYEYKFKNGAGGWENFSGSCTVGGGFGNRYVVTPANDATLDIVCFNSCEACPVADFVMINEVDADQVGTDANEFIELYDGGVGNTDLSGLVVVLFNGSDDASYDAFDLDGQSTDANGYFVIGSGTVPNVDLVVGVDNIIQNGADAVALFIGNDTDFPNDTPVTDVNLIDALVYDTGDSDDPGLLPLLNAGQPQIDEQGRGDGEAHSNQRIPNGTGGMRNTGSYDQSPPTPGEENIGIFTDWTGNSDDAWDNDDNWTNFMPGSSTNALIPASATTFPMIYIEGAECNDLTIESGASLDIYASLTVYNTFTNAGTLNILSDEFWTGSLIEYNGVSANVDRYFTGDPSASQDWHLISPPISNAQAGVFTGMYLQSFNPTNYEYTWITDELTPLNVMEGYGIYSTLSVDNTVTFSGTLNSGIQSAAISTGFDSYNWNLFGNPYPSAIDWETVTIPANMTSEVHYIEASSGNDLSYVKGVGGTGSQYIPPMQGFFVSATGADVLQFDDAVRTHNGAGIFFKNDNPQLLVIEAAGENFSDKTWIHFNDVAGVEHDGQFDAYKRISQSNPELPQIFSYTPQGVKLGINGLPQADMVPVGFTALEAGEFTISALETGDFSDVILEDILLGTQTDLLNKSYTFSYEPGSAENRFIVHFAPLNVTENAKALYTIFASDDEIRVLVPANTTGEIMVYNLMGQELISTSITGTRNIIKMNETGNYLVRVIGNDGACTGKVFIK
ncbi:MAG: lamin tail domain-containing protein [Bacteroidales bacterium]|nr:lamin tail domain-containing protein [Bacteroidales bacterium]MCF8403188.1 lamin tail domain-containing protein [Bacteroidales bacterium]